MIFWQKTRHTKHPCMFSRAQYSRSREVRKSCPRPVTCISVHFTPVLLRLHTSQPSIIRNPDSDCFLSLHCTLSPASVHCAYDTVLIHLRSPLPLLATQPSPLPYHILKCPDCLIFFVIPFLPYMPEYMPFAIVAVYSSHPYHPW